MSYFFKKNILLLSINLFCFADTNAQQTLYEETENLMKFDEMLNQIIAEHNGMDIDENAYLTEDFEEVSDGYILKLVIPKNSKVDTKIENGLLIVKILDTKKVKIETTNENGYEVIRDSSTTSFSLPNNSDETSMEKYYQNGILEIKILKK